MIDYVQGRLTYVDIQYIVIEANGIGYQIQMGNPFQYQDDENEEITIFTYQHVREDALTLYGFASRPERLLFEKLIQVSGIGPKGALAILASGTPLQVIQAIQGEDVSFLTSFPGIGKKTAQRLIIDLKDKIGEVAQLFNDANPTLYGGRNEETAGITAADHASRRTGSSSLTEALEALAALGYSEKEIKRIRPQLESEWEELENTDHYLKRGLQLLTR